MVDNRIIIKWFLIIGGIIEIFVGLLLMFIDPIFKSMGISTLPIFTQMSGAFFFCYGILLIYSNKDVEQYSIVILMNCIFRFIMIVFVIITIIQMPEFFTLLLFQLIYDPLWAIIIIVLMKKENLFSLK
ncbi:MAG: hypothetical protein ACTSQP_06160 [Promethearchaeota archaeon]